MARWLLPAFAVACFAEIAEASADEPCRGPNDAPAPPVAYFVSMVGDVRINGRPPVGELPNGIICAGDALTVGASSRAAVYLIGADTPLRLDENTVSRFDPPPEPGSGVVELIRGAIYFLSEVRRTLTIRTPYVNAGIEGTEVYLRVRDQSTPTIPAAEMIVLEGQVAITPGVRAAFPAETVTTGERVEVMAAGQPRRTSLPSPGGQFGALREIVVGALSWTLFYPDILTEPEAAQFPLIERAAQLLAAGQVADAEKVLAGVPSVGIEIGLKDALLAIIAVGRQDIESAAELAHRAAKAAPGSAVPLLAASYARQLAGDLDGALNAAEASIQLAPQAALPRARLAELHLMRGEIRQARQAAYAAVDRGGGPLAQIVLGFADLAALRGARAEAAFLQSLRAESWNPLALLGLGLAQIKQGELTTGTMEMANAVAHDPSSSLLRSYLGKAYFEARRDAAAEKQYAIAKDLDPMDPTPWFNDAIAKQLGNQPVLALRELQRSIELNDNRAPFRSRALLDQDLSARGAALARIYQNLGFERLGINTAGWSLAADPASPSAHRFLSDLYLGTPRLAVARSSELLQAQMLQDPNLQPLQPSLPFTDLDLVADAGPRTAGFNEFSPMFIGDGLRIDGAGSVGSDETVAGELGVATLIGRTALSTGVFHYQTDGFRQNFDVEHDIQNVFAQTLLTDDLSLQAEYRHRDSHGGDRRLLFDLDNFERSKRTDFDEQIYRLGGRYRLTASTDVLVSYIHAKEQLKADLEFAPGVKQLDSEHSDTDQGEAQLITRIGSARVVAGLSQASRDGEIETGFLGVKEPPTTSNVDALGTEFYAIATLNPLPSVEVSVRAGWGRVELEDNRQSKDREMSGLTPGIGITWSPPGTAITFRAAASRTIREPYAGSQTLRPTQIAGFNQVYDEFEGTRADQLNFSVQRSFGANLTLGTDTTLRWLTRELVESDGAVDLTDAEDHRASAFAYWTPTDRLAFGVQPTYEIYRAREQEVSGDPVRVRTYTLPFTAAWFHPSGVYAYTGVHGLKQEVEMSEGDQSERLDDWGVLVDIGVGYRIPRRYGTVSVRIDNLLDRQLSFQDESLRTVSDLDPRFLPTRTFLLTATFNF